MHKLTQKRYAIATHIFLAFIILEQSAYAGPVNRELIRRAGDVSLPTPRPEMMGSSPQGAQSPISSPTDLPLLKKTLKKNEAARTQPPKKSDEEKTRPEPKIKPQHTIKQPVENKAQSHRSMAKPQRNICLENLQKIAHASAAPHPAQKDKACIIPNPIFLKATKGPYPIQFTQGLILDCNFATHLARFSAQSVQAFARHHMGTALTHIQSGKGYVCRRRNNAKTGKLSHHSFGNALDWIGFKFADQSRFFIQEESQLKKNEADFFKVLRRAACGTFTTVLGPGSNAAHATHLHVDLARANEKKNPYRICE